MDSMESTISSFEVKFKQVVKSMHRDLDIRADELFQLHVAELKKLASGLLNPTTYLTSGSPARNRPVDSTRVTNRADDCLPPHGTPELHPPIGQPLENLASVSQASQALSQGISDYI